MDRSVFSVRYELNLFTYIYKIILIGEGFEDCFILLPDNYFILMRTTFYVIKVFSPTDAQLDSLKTILNLH
jgi:hypothetical protein